QIELQPAFLLEVAKEARLVLDDVEGDFGVDADLDGPLARLGGGPADRALDPTHDGFGREDPSGAGAAGAGAGLRLVQRRPDPLTGHLDEAQVGDLERFGSGPISSEMGAELLEDSFAILLGLHVDEVADDDSADVPE